ncbi:hypothetical protein A6R68_13997, partial [Neotoma lepida]
MPAVGQAEPWTLNSVAASTDFATRKIAKLLKPQKSLITWENDELTCWRQLSGLVGLRLERVATASFNPKRPPGGLRCAGLRRNATCPGEDCGKPRGTAETRSFPKARAALSAGRVQSCNDTEKRQLLWNKRGSFSRSRFCK